MYDYQPPGLELYVAPGTPENEMTQYKLPSIHVMLEHLYHCGGDLYLFLKRYIAIREYRNEVKLRFIEQVCSDPKASEEFRKIKGLVLRSIEVDLAEDKAKGNKKQVNVHLEKYGEELGQLNSVQPVEQTEPRQMSSLERLNQVIEDR